MQTVNRDVFRGVYCQTPLSVRATGLLLEKHPHPVECLDGAWYFHISKSVTEWDNWLRERGGRMIMGELGGIYLWGLEPRGWQPVTEGVVGIGLVTRDEAGRLQSTSGLKSVPSVFCLND